VQKPNRYELESDRFAWLRGRSLAAGVALVTIAVAAPAIADTSGGPLVSPKAGPMEGISKDGVYDFLGIPYAAPPIDDLRWRPPQPIPPWTQTIEAKKFANTCPQITELGVFAGPVSTTEDCLYLNVFTTKLGGSDAKAPVLLWIHGGGLVDGESNDYNATKLARGGPGGPTVVVTINYRLGLLGYLGHPALDAEGHNFGNYGLMDQQAALRWVRENIEAFGGDPDNVTVGGQSAGSTSTAANVISPLSKSLFGRAIFESGALLTVAPLSLAESRGTNFAKAAGCDAGSNSETASCLRGLSVQQILALQGTASANGPHVIPTAVSNDSHWFFSSSLAQAEDP
jgi:para-nitrobenzyl esterase